jgi:hypothetical protein
MLSVQKDNSDFVANVVAKAAIARRRQSIDFALQHTFVDQ